MYKSSELILLTKKPLKILVIIGFVIFLISTMTIKSKSENIYEFYFSPNEEYESIVPGDIGSDFLEALPEEIKRYMPEDIFSGEITKDGTIMEDKASFRYIWNSIIAGIKKQLIPAISEIALICAILLISAMLKSLGSIKDGGESGKLCNAVISLGIILSTVGTELAMLDYVEKFKDLMCNIMNGITPAFAVIYAASGNVSTTAVQSGGVMLLLALCQNLFSIILMPSVRICLAFAAADAAFPEIGAKSVASVFKNIAIWIMVISVTLFSFVLGLQNNIAQAADTFSARSIKFAVGNLIPYIGGAVSDSLGTIGGSLSLLKSVGGTAAIIAVLLLILPFILKLLLRRFSLMICKTAAGVLKCKEEEKLLSELCSISSLMLAFCSAISTSFIFTLTIFAKSSLALV